MRRQRRNRTRPVGNHGQCYQCGQPGHIAIHCPNVRCRQCDQQGHFATNCPYENCRRCGRYGHVARNCPTLWCQACGQQGHTSWNCSSSGRQGSDLETQRSQRNSQGTSHYDQVQQLTETAGHFFTTSPKLESQRDKQEVSDIHETKAVEKLSTTLEPASAQRSQGQEAPQEICPALDTTSSDKSPLLFSEEAEDDTQQPNTSESERQQVCYQCRQPGHPSLSCLARPCRDCGQPGHISTNCPNAHCGRCGEPGHIALNCPTITCQRCGRMGHSFLTCPGRKDGPPISDDATTAPRSSASQGGGQRGSDAGGTAVSSGKDQLLSTEPDDSQLAASELLGADSSGTIQKSPKQNGVKQELGDPGGKELCSLCELPGHTASDCHSLLCEACLQSGHIARDCPTIWCQLCGHKGHTTWNCSKEQKSNSASQIPFQVPQKAAEEKDRATTHPDVALWRLCARYWFPDLLQRAYFVPPVYMNSVLYRQQRVGGLDVDITKAPEANPRKGAAPAAHLSTVREDQAQQHVLHCLQKLAETLVEPMVVISQLQFGDYLGEPCYSAAAKSYPRAADLKDKDKRRGDFDLLFIHKHYGLLVAEIKSVGVSFADLPMEKGREDAVVKTRLQRALQQLCKADDVLTYLVSDLQRPPRVRKTVMLPYITKSQLRRVLADNANLTQELSKCLDTEESEDLAELCLCADHVSDKNTPWDVTPDVLGRLNQWWIRRVAGPYLSFEDDVYEDLVARFCGPATTVQIFCVTKPPVCIRSEGEGVAETSRRFTRIVLHPHQLDVLNMHLPLVWLCGPPGTGKTIVLMMRALDWSSRGWDVHVLSTSSNSLAASHLIVHQLHQSAEHARHHVRLLVFDFSEQSQVEQAVNCLVAASGSGELCIVADEAYKSSRSVFSDFCTELSSKVPGLRLWAASLYHKDKPALLAEAAMTEPLRTPPVVTREVQQSEYVVKGKTGGRMEVIRSYAVRSTPLPTDGPTPVFLYHAGQGHSQGRPGDCEMCGGEVARVLRELHVGVTGPGVPTTSSGSSLSDATTSSTSTGKASQKTADPAIPAPLKYRDVFLLTSLTSSIVEEEKDSAGNVVKPASGIVRGLREAGTAVMVLKKGDKAAVRDVAVMQGPDAIVIASAGLVRGLERKVVVYVQENNTGVNEERWGRLQVMSRTTAKLIIVVWPREPK